MEMFEDIMEQSGPSMGVAGITLGLVKENWDKDNPGKIRVELVLGEESKNVTGWIPVMTPYGGDGFGAFTLPEINSQVVVAFHLGEWDHPVVLGCLWNQKYKIPEQMADEKNTKKCFLTKGGHRIVFNEEDKKQAFSIETPGKLTIRLEDEGKLVTISDESDDNSLRLNSKDGEISLKAKKAIFLSVDGKEMIRLDGQSGITLSGNQIKGEAKQSLELKGQTTSISGTSVELKGDGSVKVESSGMLEVKGSLVKIN